MRHKLKNKFEIKIDNLAKKSFTQLQEDYKEEKQPKIVDEIVRSTSRNISIVTILFPTMLTFLPLVVPDSSKNKVINRILLVYPYGLLILLLITSCYFALRKIIWEKIKFFLKEQKLALAKEDNDLLKLEIESLINEKDKLNRMQSILATICQRLKKDSSNSSLCQIVALDILRSLGNDGKYSVAIYESYKELFWMPCFESNMEDYRVPKLYENGVTKIIGNEFKKYCSYKCLHANTSNERKKLLKSKKEIQIEFYNASDDYCQYGCIAMNVNKNHKILLEMVSYYDDIFAKDEDFVEFFSNLFKGYVPILNIIFSISISDELTQKKEVEGCV